MPNWCSSNMVITGTRDDVSRFVSLLNSLPSKRLAGRSGFGPFWLGNLVDALGGDWEKVPCRGAVYAEPDEQPSLYFRKPDDKQVFVVDEDSPDDDTATVRLSMVISWSFSENLFNFLREHFPSFELCYKSTDEFGNFHLRHDPYGLLDDEKYLLSDDNGNLTSYRSDEFKEFLDALRSLTGLEIDDDISERELNSGEFSKKFSEWYDNLPEKDPRRLIYYYAWEDV